MLTSFLTDSNSETRPDVDHSRIHQSLRLEEPAPALRIIKKCSKSLWNLLTVLQTCSNLK